ncbi:hypothetical protein OROMI_017862 [Orobanche minor]
MATTSVSNQQVTSADDHADETALQDDAVARTPPPKSSALSSSAPQTPAAGHAPAITSAATMKRLAKPSDGLGSVDKMLVMLQLWAADFSLLLLFRVFSGGLEVPYRTRMKHFRGSFVEELRLHLIKERSFYNGFSRYSSKVRLIFLEYLLLLGEAVLCPASEPTLTAVVNGQSLPPSPQLGFGIGLQASDLNNVTSASLQPQPSAIHQPSNQHTVISSTPKDAGNVAQLFFL